VEQTAGEIGYDFSGVDKPQNEESFYGLRYATFVVPLVKAVQEQQAMIEEYQAKLSAIEEENAIMKEAMKDLLDRVEKLEEK